MTGRTYPADPALAGLRLFLGWLGSFYARSVSPPEPGEPAEILQTAVTIGRRWTLEVTLLNTVAPDATVTFESARAAVEQRLDGQGLQLALWLPRGAELPAQEPALSDLVAACEAARSLEDGRLEVRFPVQLALRRSSREGSVVTVLGGLSGHWAQFTSRVPGSFLLNSQALHRLPSSEAEREALADRIVLAAGQPDVDEGVTIPAEDCWTANPLVEGSSCVVGTPVPESDDSSAALRRNVRRLLRSAIENAPPVSGDARALVLLGAATYADDEKLSWVVKGLDPALYAGFDLVAVICDGVVKPLLQPARGALPWDAPLNAG